jgi:hypothetical protein
MTEAMVILLLFDSATSKALSKALFEKLEESYATRILLKIIHHLMLIPIKER